MNTKMFKKLVALVCSLAMIVTCFSGVIFVAKAADTAEKKYTELTFADMGMDGTYTENAVFMINSKNENPKPTAPLDGVAVSGYLTFPSGGGSYGIKFAAGNRDQIELTPIKLFVQNGNLWTWNEIGATGDYNKALATAQGEQRLKVRMTFDYSDNDLVVNYYIDDADPITILYQDFVTGMTTTYGTVTCGLSARLTADVENPIKVESDKNTDRIATFHDFNLKDKTYKSETVDSGTALRGAESLDKVTISGIMNMPQNKGADYYIRFGGTTEATWPAITFFHQDNGIWIWDNLTDQGGSTNHYHIPEGDAQYYGKDLQVDISLDYAGTGLFIRVDLDKKFAGSYYFSNIADKMGTTMLVQSGGDDGITLKSTGNYSHPGTKTDAVDSTCEKEGTEAYWTCSVCGKKFSDEACTNEIEAPVAISKKSHTPVKVEGKAATCTIDGYEACYQCSGCKAYFADEAATTPIDAPKVIAKHKATYVKAVAATYTKAGMKAYYKCSCGKLYTDKALTKVTTKAKLTVAKKTLAKPAVKSAAGKSKAALVKWAKKSGVTGYEIQICSDKKCKKIVKKTTVKGAAKVSATVKGLKAKKTYYVRIRTYKTEGKAKAYSAWSSAKKVTTKK